MNMKKLLILGLILIAFSTTLTALSADEKVTSESMTLVNNKLTINDINFNIPDGYEDVESDSDSSGLDENGEKEVEDIDGTPIDSKLSKEFKNSAGEKLEIEVGIKANNVLNQPLLLPCLEEQQKIADFLSDFDTAIGKAKEELECWKEIKKGLLQQLFE